eukprot:10804874-Heterocapsa_arctica.AAC.1
MSFRRAQTPLRTSSLHGLVLRLHDLRDHGVILVLLSLLPGLVLGLVLDSLLLLPRHPDPVRDADRVAPASRMRQQARGLVEVGPAAAPRAAGADAPPAREATVHA